MGVFGADALLEAGVVLGLALLGSFTAYIKSTTRSDARLEALERQIEENKKIIDEKKKQLDDTQAERKELIDKEIRNIKFDMNRDYTRFETLIGEFRQSVTVLYNDKSDVKVDVALNYLSKVEFYAALERMSIQINGYQVTMEARFARLEERTK